jgi:tetraacyldisaccharide 4'-kinase
MSFHTLFLRISDTDDHAPGIMLLRALLRMPAWLFGFMVRWRGWMYEAGLLKAERLPVPVISVGGLTIGGAGKTPVVRYLAGLLMDMGHRPVILSRGYGRTDRRIVSVSLEENWQNVGDEPFFLATMLPDVPIVVGADRVSAGRHAIAEFQPDVLLLDDGFQHRRLQRDLDIVVYDSTGYARNLPLIPAGPSREPLTALQRAQGLILTRTDQVNAPSDVSQDIRAVNPNIQIIESIYEPVRLRRISDNTILSVDDIKKQPVLILCGIANPDSFGRTVSDLGAHVAFTLYFPDHHTYSIKDMDEVVQSARQVGTEWIITTEKDAVRIPDHLIQTHLLALDISLSIPTGEEILKNLILSLDIPK